MDVASRFSDTTLIIFLVLALIPILLNAWLIFQKNRQSNKWVKETEEEMMASEKRVFKILDELRENRKELVSSIRTMIAETKKEVEKSDLPDTPEDAAKQNKSK